MKARTTVGAAIAALAIGVAGSAVGAAAAEAPTRGEYVAQLERICKPRALATQRVMRGARAELSAEELAKVGRKFAVATRIFGATVHSMARVPRPPADVARLRKWFVYLKRQLGYLRRITTQLRARNLPRKRRAHAAQRLSARFIHNGNLANNVVLAFGFDYCSFKFSRYG